MLQQKAEDININMTALVHTADTSVMVVLKSRGYQHQHDSISSHCGHFSNGGSGASFIFSAADKQAACHLIDYLVDAAIRVFASVTATVAVTAFLSYTYTL
ncbi:hypothetical protein QE152_g4194 [Popillia japonica]|uniref:Uncharacterized protein n=1 Tax=Popillia japonica TaxID=7064 RepID=A0AAW1N1H0_POPJA